MLADAASSIIKSLSLTESIEFWVTSEKPRFVASDFLSILYLEPERAAYSQP